ncbi:Protein-cysteine N-palmitoyltransferase HHAT [Galemys pyrenaicus]|uniref:Protein-cysteine N-palmitoyltransferase HHAT n=1 Tax=Galemys pyrenaicus TaxID=202257 RepID=A0A8J5ZSG2_GALPY|nr:Protein-cysteine N-palmitoyltransferase HHAT [Galemys pyrenaicus]
MQRPAPCPPRAGLGLGLGRLLCWWFLAELMLHVGYTHALCGSAALLRTVSSWALGGLALAQVLFFYVKYLVLFGVPGLLMRLDGLSPPPLPRCVSTMCSFTGTWSVSGLPWRRLQLPVRAGATRGCRATSRPCRAALSRGRRPRPAAELPACRMHARRRLPGFCGVRAGEGVAFASFRLGVTGTGITEATSPIRAPGPLSPARYFDAGLHEFLLRCSAGHTPRDAKRAHCGGRSQKPGPCPAMPERTAVRRGAEPQNRRRTREGHGPQARTDSLSRHASPSLRTRARARPVSAFQGAAAEAGDVTRAGRVSSSPVAPAKRRASGQCHAGRSCTSRRSPSRLPVGCRGRPLRASALGPEATPGKARRAGRWRGCAGPQRRQLLVFTVSAPRDASSASSQQGRSPRYVYVPAGGSRRGLLGTLLSTALTFAFVSFWHGGHDYLWCWAALNWLGVAMESGVRRLLDTPGARDSVVSSAAGAGHCTPGRGEGGVKRGAGRGGSGDPTADVGASAESGRSGLVLAACAVCYGSECAVCATRGLTCAMCGSAHAVRVGWRAP